MTTHRMYKRTPQQHAVHQKDSIDTYATLSLDIIPVAREIIDNPMRTKPITAQIIVPVTKGPGMLISIALGGSVL